MRGKVVDLIATSCYESGFLDGGDEVREASKVILDDFLARAEALIEEAYAEGYSAAVRDSEHTSFDNEHITSDDEDELLKAAEELGIDLSAASFCWDDGMPNCS